MDHLPFAAQELERSIPERFRRVAAAWPSRPAIVSGDTHLTYVELDRRSDALATAILRRGLAPKAPIVTLLEDPVETIVALLATWKAGHPAVPLRPDAPAVRLAAILDDVAPGLIVGDPVGGSVLATLATSVERLRVDDVDEGTRASELPPVPPDGLACLLYTSGSTGEPKGVMRSHRSLLHRARSSITTLEITATDRISALHPFTAHAGMRDLLTALLSGAAILPFDLGRAGLRALASWIRSEEISALLMIPSTFRYLLESLRPSERLTSVRIVRLGGEPLFRADVEQARPRFAPGCVFVFSYGATEASAMTEYRVPAEAATAAGVVPVGYPCDEVAVVVVDDDGREVPRDQLGEVTIRSRYLADGYWRRPDLTRARFSAAPANDGTRVYRTGDLGRVRADGCLELVGRKDHQVKVHGYSVHPGEIEAALSEHPAVRETVVTARADEHGRTRLVAFVVPSGAPGLPVAEVRRFLGARLPTYMVPSAIVELERFPVGAGGKIDRAALREPDPVPSRLRTPTNDPLVDRVLAMVTEVAGGVAASGEIGFDTALGEGGLGLDSIDLFTLVVFCEKELEIRFDESVDLTKALESVGSLVELIRARRPA